MDSLQANLARKWISQLQLNPKGSSGFPHHSHCLAHCLFQIAHTSADLSITHVCLPGRTFRVGVLRSAGGWVVSIPMTCTGVYMWMLLIRALLFQRLHRFTFVKCLYKKVLFNPKHPPNSWLYVNSSPKQTFPFHRSPSCCQFDKNLLHGVEPHIFQGTFSMSQTQKI